jgi:transposase
MFSLDNTLRYWLYSQPTDMRKSFHTLSGLVNNRIGADARDGDVYIFVNKRRNRIKLLHYETGGLVIYSKMLDRGTFGMPIPSSEKQVSINISWGNLKRMVEGIMSDPDSRQARLEGLKNLWKS